MSKYINGYRVIKELDIEGFELVELVREGNLKPFSKNGRPVCDIQIKKEIENQDNCVLYMKKLELGSFEAGLVMTNRGIGGRQRAATEKLRLEHEIKALEKKGAVPLSFDQALPQEYKNCIWESFKLPTSDQMAAKMIERFKSFLYLRTEIDELKGEPPALQETKTEEGLQFQEKPQAVDHHLSQEEDPMAGSVKKIQLRYENDEQFLIKFPGKSFKPCTYADLGYSKPMNKDFMALLEVIQLGSVYLTERNLQLRLERGCMNLCNFIRRQYASSLSEDFKLWKRDRNNYYLIFAREEDIGFDPRNSLGKLSKGELIQKLKDLVQSRPPHEIKSEDDFCEWRDKRDEKITNVYAVAKKKGATEQELNEILSFLKNLEWDDQDEKNDDDLTYLERRNGFSVKNKP